LSPASPHWLSVLQPRALPVEPLPGLREFNRWLWKDLFRTISKFAALGGCAIGIGKPSGLALRLMDRLRVQLSFFDAMDDFPEFYFGISRRSLLEAELAVASRTAKLLVSSTALLMKWAEHRRDALLVLNGCDVETLPPPEACEGRSGTRVLGYIGTIGDWFDWEIVFKLAQAKPHMNIHVIGPAVAALPDRVPQNVKLLGPCRNDQAIAAMQKFSVGLIPFKPNRLTASVDPIKYYEYRAMGLPVISTCFGEMALRKNEPGVFLVDGNTDFESTVSLAASYRMGASEIEEFRTRHSWHSRFNSAGILP
jgi:glycosyltransferase involved in cell wall biosynthesis